MKRKKVAARRKTTLFPSSLTVTNPPESSRMTAPVDRFRYMMHVLVNDLELPVEVGAGGCFTPDFSHFLFFFAQREDLLTVPDQNALPYVSEDVRRYMYEYILFGNGSPSKVLGQWVGTKSLETLRLEMMRHKISEAGMDVSDFSKMAISMLPLKDMWRGDRETISVLMREISVFRAEKERKRKELAELSKSQRARRERVISRLMQGLESVGVDLDDLPWTGPEPTRTTFNRLVEGINDTSVHPYDGLAPQTMQECWDSGIRRLRLEKLYNDSN